MQSDFSLTATARAAATAEILRASDALNATAVKGVGVWRALACDALARPAACANLGPAERRRLTRAGRPCGLRLVCLAPRGANAECSAPPYKCIWCAYPAPAHAPSHGWTVAVYATPDETL